MVTQDGKCSAAAGLLPFNLSGQVSFYLSHSQTILKRSQMILKPVNLDKIYDRVYWYD